MGQIKKCWVTFQGDLCSLTIESSNPEVGLYAKERTFPANPTPEHPLRHTINIGILDQDDIDILCELLYQHRSY